MHESPHTNLMNVPSYKKFSISEQMQIKTSMMWPSQNFLLYIINIIKMKVTEWINNLENMSPPLW